MIWDESSSRSNLLFEHDLRANAFRVCREGKPVTTFPDHALARPVERLHKPDELRRSWHLDKAPDAFRTISEVAEELDIPQHVLRFWETRFVQIKPMKRSGGRRYYPPDRVDLLKGLRP